jgi:hypothetical protein
MVGIFVNRGLMTVNSGQHDHEPCALRAVAVHPILDPNAAR